MPTDILDEARKYLVDSLQGKTNRFETKQPWNKSWGVTVLHSLRVETTTLKILARENHLLSEHEIFLLRLAAILHDISKRDANENHAQAGAEIAEKWLREKLSQSLYANDMDRIVEMIADHSNKDVQEPDFSKAVLKDADTLDEIGAMGIFMASSWLESQSPFFFYDLRQRLIDFELPFCDKKLAILNTDGAKEILKEKKAFVESFIVQLSDELQADDRIEQMLRDFSKNGG
jgi:HD superfamily phosphodiesterase